MSSETKDWSEISLVPFPFSAVVIHDEEQYDAFCDAKGFKDRSWIDDNNQGDVCRYGSLAVVRFEDLSKLEQVDRVGIYAHEATHVFQGMCQYVSESEPSDEFQAYYIQRITTWLFKECECYLASTSSSSEQPSSAPSSEVDSGTSAPSEATLPNQELESQSSKESSSEVKTT